MPRVTLTDRSLPKLAVPKRGRATYYDARLPGFGLRITDRGARTWVVEYRAGRRKRRMTLGTYPTLPLADARDQAKTILRDVGRGEDPASERRNAREASTFGELAREYLDRHAKPKKRSWREDERILSRYVPRAWNGAPASSITRRDVRLVVEGIAERGAPIMANRVLACLGKVFNFGIKRELVEANPCALLDRPSAERQRDRVLTADELRRLWQALDGEDAHTAALFRLYLLTAQRGYELRTMGWADVDLEAGWWTVPPERAKNKLAHRVPLSPQAAGILADLREQANGSRWVFPGTGKSGYRETVRRALERIRPATGDSCGECAACTANEPCHAPCNVVDFVPHDLRRTVATFLTSELGASRLVVGKILNHVEPGVTKVYDRASYDGEKQAALRAWGSRLEAIVSGEPTTAKVIPLRAGV